MPRIFEAPPGFVLNPDYLVPELRAQRDALRAELKEATEAINDPAVNNLRTLAESIRMLSNQRDVLLEALRTLLSYAFTLETRLLDADGEHRAMRQARAAIKMAEGDWKATAQEAQKHFNEELKRYEGEKE